MSTFIDITTSHGRIGRFCWVNSNTTPIDLRYIIEETGLRLWNFGGWWGSAYFSSPHPARPTQAW